MLRVDVPDADDLELEHAVFDLNGTLTDRGQLIEGVSERLHALSEQLELHLASADTFGSLDRIAEAHGLSAVRVATGTEKRELVEQLGADRCVVVGNGANDVPAFQTAALAIAVVGPEGAAAAVLLSADIVCASILQALDLLLEPRTITATLRP